jgi:hypothetical protein
VGRLKYKKNIAYLGLGLSHNKGQWVFLLSGTWMWVPESVFISHACFFTMVFILVCDFMTACKIAGLRATTSERKGGDYEVEKKEK